MATVSSCDHFLYMTVSFSWLWASGKQRPGYAHFGSLTIIMSNKDKCQEQQELYFALFFLMCVSL